MQALSALLAADVPVCLTGQPGTGKTAAIIALAESEGAHLETLIGSQMDPVDVGGLPVPDAQGTVRLSPPAWARRMREALDAGRPAWLFLDELSAAPPSVQAALLRVVHERRAAEVNLGGCRVLAARNPAETAADNGILAEPMRDRFAHIDWRVDAVAWTTGEASGWGKPRPQAVAAAAGVVTAFIRKNPQALVAERCNGDGALASPRSWSALVRAMSTGERGLWPALASACVGPDAATEFTAWLAANDLPDPEDILSGSVALPKRADQRYAALAAMASVALAEHPDRAQRIRLAWEIVSGLPADVGMVAAKILSAGTPGESDEVERDLAERLTMAEARLCR